MYHIIYNATLVMAAVSATILTFAIIVFLCTKKFSESTLCHFYVISRNQDNQLSSNLPKMCLNIREPLKGGVRFYKSQRIYYYCHHHHHHYYYHVFIKTVLSLFAIIRQQYLLHISVHFIFNQISLSKFVLTRSGTTNLRIKPVRNIRIYPHCSKNRYS